MDILVTIAVVIKHVRITTLVINLLFLQVRLVLRQDRCTITISGSLREASAYTGTVQLSVRYNKRNCNSYNNGVGETETVTLSFPYQTQHRYMMSSCTMDTNGNCTVYVAGVNIIGGTYGANPSTYNGKKIKIDLQNQGG